MLAPKYTISTLVIALAVLIGFTVKNPENMALNAALTNTNDHQTIPTEPAQPAQSAESATLEPTPSATPIIKSTIEAAPSTSSPARTTKPIAKPSATPKAAAPSLSPPATQPGEAETPTAAAPAITIESQENLAPQASPTPTVVIAATPSIKPAIEPIREGDDPVPGVKKVNLASAEIVKIKEQYEQKAASDSKDEMWKRKADLLIIKGMSFLGTPYVLGAKGGQTDAFDCSSFLQYLFATQEVSLPRDTGQQSERGTEVSMNELREGDLVFFTTPKRKNKEGTEQIGHVAVYMGNGLILHTFRSGIGVTISELDAVWKERFVKAKRVLS
ncbi:NlpC/P60 family protein [Paenibacillus chondroitinus]|uniref:NlpC/P60 family protein n=1 Tax=Paenibacillus chondroitinus TaxID=59842 RepID=A0ABU6DJ69_9BACL|nr:MULTISPECIES: C40 family peptidase [Paenibacillus]MCY9657547.1 NlpC/P60 family protein [Paenibacillus anseongense]MEB4797803.1 NlpC/P60 family protein [Paenibacillus chondroitinus]